MELLVRPGKAFYQGEYRVAWVLNQYSIKSKIIQMNKLIFSSLLLLTAAGLSAQGMHSHAQAPSTVTESFQKDYPDAKQPQWKQSNGQWNANFKRTSDNHNVAAYYDGKGQHIDSHVNLHKTDVPAPVVDRVSSKYPGGHVSQYTKIERPNDNEVYQVKVKQHNKSRTVYVDGQGKDQSYRDKH
jgi:hypothetical protein